MYLIDYQQTVNNNPIDYSNSLQLTVGADNTDEIGKKDVELSCGNVSGKSEP